MCDAHFVLLGVPFVEWHLGHRLHGLVCAVSMPLSHESRCVPFDHWLMLWQKILCYQRFDYLVEGHVSNHLVWNLTIVAKRQVD